MKSKLARALLLSLLLLLLLSVSDKTLSAGKRDRLSLYRDAQAGIEFRFPAGWTHERCSDASGPDECIGFRKRVRGNRQPAPDYIMTVAVTNMDLEHAMDSHILFERVNGQWVKNGRFSTVKAQKISRNNWHGMYAVADCGITDATGFHAAGGECLTAFLSEGNRTVIIETDGTIDTDKVFNQVIKSFKFIDRGQPRTPTTD